MRTKYKAWTKPYLEEHAEVEITLDALKDIKEDIYLEIGSGKGQFLLDMAMKFPKLFFIGIERNVTCAGFTCKKLVENEITNAKLIRDDAMMVMDSFIEKSVSVIFLNFSDPWPKKRHAKRRLTSNQFLDKYLRVLKDDGKIIFKTDNVDLFEFTKELIEESPFKLVSIDENYDGNEEFDAQTEYEKDFRSQGVPIHRLVLMKK